MTHDPQSNAISVFVVVIHIFIIVEFRDFKFGTQLDHGQSQPVDDKLLLKRAWLWSRDPFKFSVPLKYLQNESLKLETSTFVQWFAMW